MLREHCSALAETEGGASGCTLSDPEKEDEKVSKRILRLMAVAGLALALLVPSVAAAAPVVPVAGQVSVAPWYARWQPFQVWPGWGYTPEKGTGLQYQLIHVPERNEVQLLVVNPTGKAITVTTPTAMKTDFALWRDGSLVWRASTDKAFAQVVTKETFGPGEGKVYTETLPYAASGVYFLQAYYVGETKWTPVAATYVWLQATYQPLQYTVEYLGAGWFNSSPRLRVTIKNTSGRDITLPYQYGYQVLVKRPGAREYIGTVGIGQSLGTIEAGATRYVFVNLDGLPPGSYQADVRSNVADGYYRVVAQTWFYTW